MRLWALLGPAGSGKSTITRHLIAMYGAKEYALAHPLKKLVRVAFDLPKEAVWGTQAEKEMIRECGFSGRQLMQRVGQGVRAAWGDDFWAKDVLRQIEQDQPNFAIISDCRYINESALIRKSGGRVVRLDTPERETSTDGSHPSEYEWELAAYDYLIAPAKKDLNLLFGMIDNVPWL